MEDRTDERRYWDRVSDNYDALYSHKFSQGEDRALQEWIASAVEKRTNLRVLDIGCGTGFGLALLMKVSKQFSYAGVDLSEGMVSQLQSKVYGMTPAIDIDVRVADARAIDQIFSPNSFDLIVLFNAVGSYIGSPSRFLRKARVLLSDDGLLFASFLNRTALRRCVRGRRGIIETYNTRGAAPDLPGVEAVTVSEDALRRRCARLGFEIKWIRYQSVLGGIWESDAAAPVEMLAGLLVPRLGHTINLLVRKPEFA